MATNIATTPSQSRRLLECGVDPKTADMCWYKAKAANKEGYSWMLCSENYLKRHDSDEFIPAWSLSTLLTLIPPIIYAPDITDVPDDLSEEDEIAGNWVPPIREYQWQMWCNPGRSFEFEGEKTVTPPVYGMKYTSVRFLPPTHPIAPNSPLTLYLYDEDGIALAWTDENPVEVCVKAIEWLTANNYKLNEL